MNFGEGRSLSEDMASLGYEEAVSADDADIVILNTCTVVGTTEKHMIDRISELRATGKKIVVTGCTPFAIHLVVFSKIYGVFHLYPYKF